MKKTSFRMYLISGWILFAGILIGARYSSALTLTKTYLHGKPSHYLPLILQETLGLITFHGHIAQDRWIVAEVYPGIKDGFFLDVGSGDGIDMSNTKVLEDLGWSGICVDPFPTRMESRTCQVAKNVVSSIAGQKVQFRRAGFLGGIDEHIHKLKQAVESRPLVELETVTLRQILADMKAPEFIHYMSLDIEGGELEALKGFPFDTHTVGAITVEHLNEEPRRNDLYQFLRSKGYELARSAFHEDWYLYTGDAQEN